MADTKLLVVVGIVFGVLFILLLFIYCLGCCDEEKSDVLEEGWQAQLKTSFDPSQFTYIEEIHTTKFSHVIKVHDKRDGRSYCMKRMNARNPSHLKHCIREVDTLTRLHHTNIVKFYGVGIEESETGSWICILLEYVVGGTIADMIIRGKFGTQLTQSFSQHILFGLEYLHQNNIVHRDLKGRNVLVSNDGICKLSDFGTSSFFENVTSYRAGTVHWMAPEALTKHGQILDAEIIKRQDVWSFGACIFEMMCGHPPLHTIDDLQVVYYYHNELELQYPESISRDPILFDIVKRCVRYNPEDRPTPTELLEHPFFEQEYADEEPGRLSLRSDTWGSKSMNFTIF